MRRLSTVACTLFLLLFCAAIAFAAEGSETAGVTATLNVPMFSPLFADTPVATVDDEKITLDELNDALASVHESVSGEKQAPKTDYKPVLDRIINTRLINLEADEMGIDSLPEVKSAIKDYEGASLREILKNRQTGDVKPDKEAIDKLYKEAVKEWKIRSLIFDKEEDAKKMADEVKKGMNFDDASKKYIADKKAKGGEEGEYVKVDKLLPPIAEAVFRLDKGAVSGLVRLSKGFVILKVEDVRYPDDPKAKAEAIQKALEDKRLEALRKYYAGIVKKNAKVDKKLFGSLDFDAGKPAFADVMKDKRVLVSIKGEKPITVADLAEAIGEKFFHGVERAVGEKKVNERKTELLDEMLYKRLFDKEAQRQGLNKTDDYKRLIAEYKVSVIFSTFIQKAVVPDIKVNEDETKKYYEGHIADFTYPEMVRLYGVVFGNLKDAESALGKLKEGTDFKWLKANAEGQLGEDTQGLINFNGDLISVKSLPDDLQKALTGVKGGDFRLYSGPGEQYYVLYVKDEVPPKEQPYKEAREAIAKKIFNEKLNKSVADWADKLRKGHQVRVYITGMGKPSE